MGIFESPGGREEMMVGWDQAELGWRKERSRSAGPGRHRQWLNRISAVLA